MIYLLENPHGGVNRHEDKWRGIWGATCVCSKNAIASLFLGDNTDTSKLGNCRFCPVVFVRWVCWSIRASNSSYDFPDWRNALLVHLLLFL